MDLSGPAVELDVATFRTLSRADAGPSELAAAITEFSGPFMEGFALRDSPDFDDWQQGERGSLDRELASALRKMTAHLVAEGRFEEAVPLSRRWLALDPLHEPAQRELIRLQAWSGDRAAALEQYRACVRILNEELGVSPVAETTARYHRPISARSQHTQRAWGAT
jgi:DNA-binding SARP family transcriptional activator